MSYASEFDGVEKREFQGECMHFLVEQYVVQLLQDVFMLNKSTAEDAWEMAGRVISLCLTRHVGICDHKDVLAVKKILMNRLIQEADDPSYFDKAERGSVQTCIVVMTREVTLNYVRNAHYAQSSLADIFRAMNVDVEGAGPYLAGLDQMFSSSQRCVLRLIYGEGCTVIQAAGMLGVSPQEVQTLQSQAMELLQHEWLILRKGGRC